MTRARPGALVGSEIHKEGSTITQIDHDAAPEPSTRERVRRSRPRAKEPAHRRLKLAGYVMIAAGVALLAWVAWEFWGTNWVSHQRQEEVAHQLQESWKNGDDSAQTKFGRATAILHVPRFGDDYAVPVLEGSDDDVLAAGIGHMLDTADAGQKGNYVLAAHRVTHGEPFADFPELRAGDKVYVETRTATYEYVLDFGGTDLEVPFTDEWVIQPFPQNPDGGVQPPPDVGKHLITLLTCAEIFHTEQRSVVFGHLVGTEPADR